MKALFVAIRMLFGFIFSVLWAGIAMALIGFIAHGMYFMFLIGWRLL